MAQSPPWLLEQRWQDFQRRCLALRKVKLVRDIAGLLCIDLKLLGQLTLGVINNLLLLPRRRLVALKEELMLLLFRLLDVLVLVPDLLLEG